MSEKQRSSQENGVLGGRPWWVKAAHIAFWTLLFYGMSAGLAKFLEWAGP